MAAIEQTEISTSCKGDQSENSAKKRLMKLFVPGRICLLGEPSDWAGGYRRINADIERGYTIITGTNQGIHAEVEPHPNKLILTSTLGDGTRKGPFEVEMEREALLEVAEQGGCFSYAAGVAYQVLTHYRVRGLKIDNFLTDLPIKKYLSSSAAVSVMVARAFNRIYDLKMTIRGEMEYAYMGEITTPFRCGRMDQGCAYGNRPIMMTFDGERGEFQLTSCLDRLRQEDGVAGCVVQGRRFDIGLPEAYRQTVIDFRNA